MKNFDIQVNLMPNLGEAMVALVECKNGGETIIRVVNEKDTYQTGCELLAQALGVNKPDRDRMLFDGLPGDYDVDDFMQNLLRYSGA